MHQIILHSSAIKGKMSRSTSKYYSMFSRPPKTACTLVFFHTAGQNRANSVKNHEGYISTRALQYQKLLVKRRSFEDSL